MNEQDRDLTGAWALNALDAEERARIEELFAQDPEAAGEARSFEETAAELAAGLEPEAPRPELKSSLMARIARTPQHSVESSEPAVPAEVTQDDSATGPTHRRADVPPHVPENEDENVDDDRHQHDDPHEGRAENEDGTETRDEDRVEDQATVIPLDRYRSSVRRSRWLAVAAAALMVTSVAGVGLWSAERAAQDEDRATIEALQSQQAASDEERQMISALLTAEDTSQLTVPSETGGTLHVMYSRDQQSMIVQGADLPDLPSDSTYQLWIIGDGGDSFEDAGLITEPGQTVMAHEELPPESLIGLTVEPAGGSEQPTTDPIASSEL